MEDRIQELEAELHRWQAIAEGIADDAARQAAHLRAELAETERALRSSRNVILLVLILSAAQLILCALGGIAL